jgi:hypothetical protein
MERLPLFLIAVLPPPNHIGLPPLDTRYPGYIWPWNCIYLAICLVSHAYTTPDAAVCAAYAWKWIAQVYLRNLALLWMVSGGWHLLLYQLKVMGTNQKYDAKWQAEHNSRFLFNDQVYDNIFWSCTSGVGIWTACVSGLPCSSPSYGISVGIRSVLGSQKDGVDVNACWLEA